MLAASGGSQLVLYSAHDEGGEGSAARHTERHIEHLFNEALALNIAVTRISETGPITRLLPHRIQAEAADLVFYPLPPGERYGAPLQRHTAHHLLQTVRADLAIMRIMHMGKPHPRHILVPLGDVVSDREQRVSFLAMLARSFHAQLTLFHRPDGRRQDSPADFIAVRNALRTHHLPVLERSGRGHIAKAITLEAVSHHNDLIVLGASERGVLRRMFFGNPAGDVMHHPPCNAILFRAAPALL
jgi:nucleotide-binding universal stress UspA family protein